MAQEPSNGLTTQEILGIINDTASKLGFDFVATESNLDSIIVTQPAQVNRFVDALNPIIHDKIMSNLGNRGFMRRFIDKQRGGSTSRHMSFGYATDNPSNPTPNTLEALVGEYKKTPHVSIFSINRTYSQPVTVDRRELAKVFTARALITYIETLSDYLENSFAVFILNTITKIAHDNISKMINKVDAALTYPYNINDLIELHQAIYSGSLAKDSIENQFNGFTIPQNVEKNLTPYDSALLVNFAETGWFTDYHFHPDGIDRFVVHTPSGKETAFFLVPYDAIVIEEYNRYVEVQTIPNCPGKYNIFFNSDLTINIDFKYPICVHAQGAYTNS